MIVIFGASGHAKEVEHLLRNEICNPVAVQFFVDNSSKDKVNNISVISESDFMEILDMYNDTCFGYVGIGNVAIRKKVANKFSGLIKFENLLANRGYTDSFNNLGLGNFLFPGSQFTTNISIGNHNHFNLSCSISHDCSIGNYNTFSPGVRLAGNVTVGNFNFFGVNATVIDGVSIADNIVIGAGAVVVKDITEPGTYIGVPAKRKQ